VRCSLSTDRHRYCTGGGGRHSNNNDDNIINIMIMSLRFYFFAAASNASLWPTIRSTIKLRYASTVTGCPTIMSLYTVLKQQLTTAVADCSREVSLLWRNNSVLFLRRAIITRVTGPTRVYRDRKAYIIVFLSVRRPRVK